MNILVHSNHKPQNALGKLVDIDKLFAESDFLTIHAALNDRTKGLVNKSVISLMKPSAYLINTSRGAIINEPDLADALNNGTISGAALDVLSKEPPTSDNPLLTARNCIITPHIAWVSQESRQRLMNVAVDNIKGFLNKKPVNTVN